MVELVDTEVSKAFVERRVGSSPILATNVGVADFWYHTTSLSDYKKTISKQSYSQDWAEETGPSEYLLF